MNGNDMKPEMEDYFEGKKLYGNDFLPGQISKWYEEESEGYADLGNKNLSTYCYEYHEMNKIHGFNKIKDRVFNNVLGFGSAWGYEFEPIIGKIEKLTIIEPSDNLLSDKIGSLVPVYVKPNVNGELPFDKDSFDLITCFGVLHHIPNVSFVLGELIRVLKPNGHLLMQEPIVSMGDWRQKREGLTKNERGIPVSFFDFEFKKYPVRIISKEFCFTATYRLEKVLGKFIKKPVYSFRYYVHFDKYLPNILRRNVHYHAKKGLHKIAPSSIFFVVKKNYENE